MVASFYQVGALSITGASGGAGPTGSRAYRATPSTPEDTSAGLHRRTTKAVSEAGAGTPGEARGPAPSDPRTHLGDSLLPAPANPHPSRLNPETRSSGRW